MWQDYAIALVQWMVGLALVPTIFHKSGKPALSTAVFTAAPLALLAYTFATLHLWNGAVATGFGCLAWCVLGIQRYKLNRGR